MCVGGFARRLYGDVAHNMKYTFYLLFTLVILSCNNSDERIIEIIANDETWVGYEQGIIRKEIKLCGADEETEISIKKGLSQQDTIYNLSGSEVGEFVYESIPEKSGTFEIEYLIKSKGIEQIFSQTIVVIKKPKIEGFNVRDAYRLKRGIDNEIKIIIGVPDEFVELSSNNGTISRVDGKILVKPSDLGECVIDVAITLPNGEKTKFNSIKFVVEQ